MKFTIKNKLILAFGIIIILASFNGLYSIVSVKSVNDKSSEITEVWFKGNNLAHSMDLAITDYRIREYRHVVTDDDNIMSGAENEIVEFKDKFEKSLNEYQGTATLQREKDLVAEIKISYPKYIEVSNKVLALSRAGKNEEANQLMLGESKQNFDNVNDKVEELIDLNEEQANTANEQSNKTYEKSKFILIIVTAMIIILSIVVAAYSVTRF